MHFAQFTVGRCQEHRVYCGGVSGAWCPAAVLWKFLTDNIAGRRMKLAKCQWGAGAEALNHPSSFD